jgi:hypothetical protein
MAEIDYRTRHHRDDLRHKDHIKQVQTLAVAALQKFPKIDLIFNDENNKTRFQRIFKCHFDLYHYYNSSDLADSSNWNMLEGHLGKHYIEIASIMNGLSHMLFEPHEPVEYIERGHSRIRELYEEHNYTESPMKPEEPIKISIRLSDISRSVFLPEISKIIAPWEQNTIFSQLEMYQAIIDKAAKVIWNPLNLIANTSPKTWDQSGMSSVCPLCNSKSKKSSVIRAA